mmetsp:Transcript_4687/g.6319  ORF Transcript_4687/g.6319 Transcript_4687/m.6319 type:complete len:301 (-) Transcript_4687:400-1302(-)|eukprot:CAMPEP_0196581124 /NCGR_PEP_ID=MMETSP1081-20130531/32533_1 /TAXON_ID=36882 /ORGANISM="Pyramimonas amylifera, Strain CCMP720" /LENGTH=300 /DNA_ID=CAMNT_0041901235 /DNA_START=451 /DNA_END=1353 /DNA_ORIENTATION=+
MGQGVAEGNVALAFAFVIGAGLATTIGSTFVFCTKLADQTVLAGALGISAGVMLYVSFAEIFCIKAIDAFELAGYDRDVAIRYSTFCFFCGITLTVILDKLVHYLVGGEVFSHEVPLQTSPRDQNSIEAGKMGEDDSDTSTEQQMKNRDLQKMGLLSALAIGLHNFPEGLATFVATLADTSVGLAIAVAITLHNIPEGICVAMPIYYATGSRWRGLWWSFISGISEPIGGLIGYLVLYGDNMSEVAYGSLFGIVGGMMVYIAVIELIPTALRYDPSDQYVTLGVLVGMGLMAASILMFAI